MKLKCGSVHESLSYHAFHLVFKHLAKGRGGTFSCLRDGTSRRACLRELRRYVQHASRADTPSSIQALLYRESYPSSPKAILLRWTRSAHPHYSSNSQELTSKPSKDFWARATACQFERRFRSEFRSSVSSAAVAFTFTSG